MRIGEILEIIQETGELALMDIDNVEVLQRELLQSGWRSYVDENTDYLICSPVREYCTQNGGDCYTCLLVNYGRDCFNNLVK